MFVNLLKSFNIENVYSKYDDISYLLDVFLLKYMRIQLYPNLHFECRAELARGRTYSAADLPRRCLHLVTKTDFAKTCISHVDNVQFYLVFGEKFCGVMLRIKFQTPNMSENMCSECFTCNLIPNLYITFQIVI